MRAVDIILKKRGGGSLSREEIEYLIRGYVADTIPDYQMAAFLMAVWFKGMDSGETAAMTLAMADSGDRVDLSAIPGFKVDKHSTGGVADTTTLVVAPLVAACGGRVAKMSGRGLGHTGGTIDKLESIPGFSVSLSMESFVKIVSTIGLSVIGQTTNLVPADKKLYALRDVTGTVDNISLIAASIMSKKLASGSDGIVLDVKTGSGAFMRETDEARELARVMVDIGNRAGRKTVALVTDMNQPLGNAIGNALEVREAIEILRGEHRTGDLAEVSIALGAQMLLLSGIANDEMEARRRLSDALESGEGLERFRRMIAAHGGDPKGCDDPALLPHAQRTVSVRSPADGYLSRIKNDAVGTASQLLGAGRQRKEDVIDPAVGIWMEKRLGDMVEKGEEIAVFHVNDEKNLEESVALFLGALECSREEPDPNPWNYGTVR